MGGSVTAHHRQPSTQTPLHHKVDSRQSTSDLTHPIVAHAVLKETNSRLMRCCAGCLQPRLCALARPFLSLKLEVPVKDSLTWTSVCLSEGCLSLDER